MPAEHSNLSRNDNSSRHSSSDDVNLQRDLAYALCIQMPGLSKTIVVSGGKDRDRLYIDGSRESAMPKTNTEATTSTHVNVEPVLAYSREAKRAKMWRGCLVCLK